MLFTSGIEWKKVYSLTHTSNELFKNLKDAKNKNADNETADLFSILDELEQYKSCSGDFHLKIYYPQLAENFSFPCNEWTQSSNPVSDSIVRDFKPINITFQSQTKDFQGLGMNEWGKEDNLIEDFPFLKNNRSFSVGTINDKDGKIIGPGSYLVERVELFVNTGKI